jgi:hypothetical protein
MILFEIGFVDSVRNRNCGFCSKLDSWILFEIGFVDFVRNRIRGFCSKSDSWILFEIEIVDFVRNRIRGNAALIQGDQEPILRLFNL